MEHLAADILLALVAGGIGTAVNVAAVMLPSTRDDSGIALRIVAVAMSAATLVLPFLLDGPPVLRAILAQGLIVHTWRVIEIARTPSRFSRRERTARILLLPYEFTFLERTKRRWPLRDLALSGLLFTGGLLVLLLASRLSPPVTPYSREGWPRWLGATVAGYVLMEGMTRQWVGILPAFGWRHRPYQNHPILSRTIAEFWGKRWSSVVHRWLRTNMYQPLVRRGAPRLGILAAFAMSAAIHGFMIWPAAGVVPALWMLGFFFAHGFFMLVEAKLRIRRWRPLAGRLYVIAVFAVTVPLFMEPLLRALGL